MSLLRSLRSVSIVAIFAAVLMALLPLGGFISMSTAPNQAVASDMSDCGMCPRTDMVMVNCAQALCGLPAMEATGLAGVTISPPLYAPARVAIPLGRHTIPPVSPG